MGMPYALVPCPISEIKIVIQLEKNWKIKDIEL